jgi:hypothetical protein
MPKAERLQVWLPGRESGDGERHNGASLPAVPASHKVISRGRLQCPGGATYESRQVWPLMAPKQAASTRNKLPPARKDLSSVTVTVTFLRLSLLNQPSLLSPQLHLASCISILHLHLHQQQTSKARSLFCVELPTIYSSLGRILDLIAHHEERSSHCRRASGLCPGRHPQDEAQQGSSCRHTGTTGSHDAIIARTVQAL